jgi:glycosyltransferase involved in cell wall biosynthesis
MTVGHADLYFAYTAGVAQEVAAWGVPKERIVSVQNAVDTRELQTHIRSIADSELEILRARYGMRPGAAVGLFCGMLDPVKAVPFLIDCCRIIKERLERPFHLILIGGGNEQEAIRSMISDLPWVHAVGPKFGREKAALFKLSDLFLLPGRVGLVILDAFAAGLPLMTVQRSSICRME